MALYQLRTFQDIYKAVMEELGISSSDTTAINNVKRDINIVYQEITAEKNWWWLEGTATLQLPAYISTGTVNVSQGSADITFSSAPAQSQKGKLFAVEGFSEIYVIESHTAGSTSAKLTELYAGTTNTTASYKLWTDRIPLPTDLKETVNVWHEHHTIPLEAMGKQDYRKMVLRAPRAEGKPVYYYTGDYVDPAPTSSISSLPAVSTRASAGVIKTIVFASGLPSAVTTNYTEGKPLRWRVSNAGQPSYNGDILISSISTTTNTNDTITYTGKAEYQESATSDTSMSIVQLDQEADYDRYRELFLYPCLDTSRISLRVDYVKEVFPLENDSDEPAIPIHDRSLLLYAALHRAWSRARNPEEATRNWQLYQNKLAKMAGKTQDTFDTPRLSPSRSYLGAKRSSMRRLKLSDSTFAPSNGGSGSGQVVTGTASSVATFNSSGELEGSSTISTTELGYLNGVTSNLQTQLDAKVSTTLTDGQILVGNGSNVATGVTPSGDVTITNAGVTAIAAGAIVNADVNASAAIAHSKLADITAGSILMGNASNVPTATAVTGDVTISSSGVTAIASGAIVNADVNASAAIAYSKLSLTDSIVDADINSAAAIARSKVANGTADHVVINSAAGALSSEASLSVVRGGTGAASLTANNVILGNGTSAVQFVAPGTSGNVLTSNGTTWASSTPASAPTSSDELTNLGLAASVGSSALTIALKGKDGNDPSGSNKVKIGFRDSTAATGTYNQREVTGALSLTISSGSTLGHTSGGTHYIYVYAVDSDGAGTVKLAASSARFDDGSVQTTVAEGGAGAADSLTSLYSDAVYSSKPVRLIGRLKSVQTTAGTWAAVPTEISLRPFDTYPLGLVGSAYTATTTSAASTRTSTTLGPITSDTDWPGPTIEFNNTLLGTLQTTDADGPSFTVNDLVPGVYKVVISFQGYVSAAARVVATINDGTTSSGRFGKNTGRDEGLGGEVTGFFRYATSGNRTFTLWVASAAGTVTVNNDAADTATWFSIERVGDYF